MKKILYVRSGPYQVNPDAYNLQELGLASAFAKEEIQCDVLYYHKKKNFNQIITKNNHRISILWRKGIRLLRSGVYPQILRRDLLSAYDAIIVSEYSQIMSVLLSFLHPNVYIYNGPYYNLFKLPFLEKVYDFLFVKLLNKRVKKIFCKTEMSKKYLEEKGFTNCFVTGVGLDVEKFENDNEIDKLTSEVLKIMENKRNIVYVGSINRRKNVEVITKSFELLKKRNADMTNLQLIIIGKDENNYWKECKKYLSEETQKYVYHIPHINNSQLKEIYKKTDIFTLPSRQEIFGMVLLEAMYFSVATIASGSAGAKTLIVDGESGLIIPDFDIKHWVEKLEFLLFDDDTRMVIGENAKKRIESSFMWDKIVKKMIKEFDNE